jgi:hypothetical protein
LAQELDGAWSEKGHKEKEREMPADEAKAASGSASIHPFLPAAQVAAPARWPQYVGRNLPAVGRHTQKGQHERE